VILDPTRLGQVSRLKAPVLSEKAEIISNLRPFWEARESLGSDRNSLI
jgi:hypothetical protein